jgi:acetyl-CoA carboxylase biotin carboxylase subunit
VGGIKTNISLFRRILESPDFQAGKLDTGFLDRLLAVPAAPPGHKDTDVAAIAAGVFAVLDPASSPNGSSANGSAGSNNRAMQSAWKKTARIEGLGRKE